MSIEQTTLSTWLKWNLYKFEKLMLGLIFSTMLSAITFISFLGEGKEKNMIARLKEKV
jgi:cell division protein FtsL